MLNFILKELPDLENQIKEIKRLIDSFREKERSYTDTLQKSGALDELQNVIRKLNAAYEKRGILEEQKRLWDRALPNTC